jgi:hypothetical protein
MSDSFTLLPANLGCLARAASELPARYSTAGVHVTLRPGEYEAAATNGKVLAVVTGSPAHPLDFPPVAELSELPASASQAVIPAQAWKSAFASAPKRKGEPGAGLVAVHLSEQESILTTINDSEANVQRTENVQGRFPDYRAVLAITGRKPSVVVRVDPTLLLDMVKLAQAIGGRETAVTMELRGARDPIVLRTDNGEQKFVGLLMPMTA